MKDEIYKQFCEDFRLKLQAITDPVALTNNRSYDALCDVITNVILLEINMDKMPSDQISKKEVRLPTGDEVGKMALRHLSKKAIAKELLERLTEEVSYNDRDVKDMSTITIQSMGLYSALTNYINQTTL